MSPDIILRQIATIGICLVQVYLICLWAYASIRTGLGFFWLFVCAGVLYVGLAFISVALVFAAPQIESAFGPLFPAFLRVFTVAQPFALAFGAVAHTLLVFWILRSRPILSSNQET